MSSSLSRGFEHRRHLETFTRTHNMNNNSIFMSSHHDQYRSSSTTTRSSSKQIIEDEEGDLMMRIKGRSDLQPIMIRSDHNNKVISTTTRSNEDHEDIDKCAEAFIKRFRQQLQIQRLQSLEDYENMLARGL